MRTSTLLCSLSLLVAAALLPGCSGECTRASDCAADEVCYQEVCTKASSEFFAQTCSKDSDCDGNADGENTFHCELGRCRIREMQGQGNPDGGPGDAMPTDTGTTADGGS